MAKITNKITSIEEGLDNRANIQISAAPKEPVAVDLADAIKRVDPPQPARAATNDMRRPFTETANTSTIFSEQPGWIRTVTLLSVFFWLAIASIISFVLLDISGQYKSYSALHWAGLSGLILGPLMMIAVAAYSFKQLSKFSAHAQVLANAAHALSQPDKAVLEKSEIMTGAIARQVEHVNEKLNASFGRLSSLETVLSSQAETLSKSNAEAKKTAEGITHSLQQQEQGLTSIANTFDERMGALSMMVTEHTDNLANATHLAEQKIKEARISVEGAAAKINSASDIVRTNTVQATSTLSASHADIKSLGDIIRERGVELDTVYKKHAGDLTSMIEYLRDEQQNLGAIFEDRLSVMRDLSLSAQASAESLSEASESGKDTIEALAKAASLADSAVKIRFKEMQDMVQYSNDSAQSISDKAAQRVKDSLELTRKQIARIERDMAALQNRVSQPSNHSLELVPDDNTEASEETNLLTSKKRNWTRLKLKPVEDDLQQAPFIDSIDVEDIQPIQTDTASQAIDRPESEINTATPITPDMETPLDLYVEPTENLEKPIYTPTKNTEITAKASDKEPRDMVRTALPVEAVKKAKPNFSFRGIFNKIDKTQNVSSLDIVKPNLMPDPLSIAAKDDALDILPILNTLGLPPNVVVDDGCVILAANSRANKGHDAMSRVVTDRLKDPVEHMANALSIDSELSQKIIAFATHYNKSVETLANDHEAIRTHLESENGRAYLLCDAALNYGRI